MKAMVLEQYREPMPVREVQDPSCPPDGAVIRVEANGICRSDWHAWIGDWPWRFTFPHVLGHEFTGVVQEVGPLVTNFGLGDRVIVPFSQGDGSCSYCLSGHSNVCAHIKMPGMTYWGGYGQYVSVPQADTNLVRLPDTVSFVVGASLGCRFMTAFHGLLDQAEIRPGEWVAIHGCGGVGLSAVHIAKATGARVIAVDISDDKLEMARQLGAEVVLNARVNSPVEAIQDLTQGGSDVAVDALGIRNTCQNALASLKKRGRHLQLGLTTLTDGQIDLSIDTIVRGELRVIGSLGMPAWRYSSLLGMVAAGTLTPEKLVTKTVPIDDASAVLASMTDFATVGVVVVDRW